MKRCTLQILLFLLLIVAGENLIAQGLIQTSASERLPLGGDTLNLRYFCIPPPVASANLFDISLDGMQASVVCQISKFVIALCAKNIIYAVWSSGQLESEEPLFIEPIVPEVIVARDAPFFVKGNLAFWF